MHAWLHHPRRLPPSATSRAVMSQCRRCGAPHPVASPLPSLDSSPEGSGTAASAGGFISTPPPVAPHLSVDVKVNYNNKRVSRCPVHLCGESRMEYTGRCGQFPFRQQQCRMAVPPRAKPHHSSSTPHSSRKSWYTRGCVMMSYCACVSCGC